jgi:hypothetical protein
MGSLRHRRSRRTRFASLVLCVTFIAAHPAIVCTLMCLSQGHELAAHAQAPMQGPMDHHHAGAPGAPSCHSRQLTTPQVTIAAVLPPALPTHAESALPEWDAALGSATLMAPILHSHEPAVDHPPPRLA